jgi:uncharacterized protein (DUF1015 family)
MNPLFAPFPAVRFKGVKDLTPLLCPPYDIIGPELAEKLRGQARNAIHVELPAGEYGDAAGLWKEWLSHGVVARDERPAFYVVEQTFERGGKKRRLGVFGALRLEQPGGAVMPHENTFPKAREDRMKLLKAVKINTSPVFGTFRDPKSELAKLVSGLGEPDATGTAPDGSLYRLWRVDDPAAVKKLGETVDHSKVLIADGHHRYRVALEFGQSEKLPGSDRTLAYLVPDDDPGLVVLPTHRLAPEAAASLEAAQSQCEVAEQKDLKQLEAKLGGTSFGLIVRNGKGNRYFHCSPKKAKPGLDVEWVQRTFLKDAGPAQGMEYLHEAAEVERRVRETPGKVGVLLGPLTVPAIRAAVEANGLLPQKSTYFYPKVATGLVFRTLDG